MKLALRCALVCFVFLLAGCVAQPQPPVPFSNDFWNPEGKKIGVVMTAVPELNVHLPGAGCLLCLAVAEGANARLSKHVEGLTFEEVTALKADTAEALRKRGFEVVAIDAAIAPADLPKSPLKTLNALSKDYSSFQSRYGITHLLVIDLRLLGMQRSYANYVPTSDPMGIFSAESYVVDLASNSYAWYLPVSVLKSAEGDWDEPPTFPALTNAYYQAIAAGRDAILVPLSQ